MYKAPMGDLEKTRDNQAKDIGILFSLELALVLVSLSLLVGFIGYRTRPMSGYLHGTLIGSKQRLIKSERA
jgi:hypothetical protein